MPLNTEIVAIGTDTPEGTKALKANADGIKFPMPMLADPKLDLFRLYRAYDDFEDVPLHGTFLIDAQGRRPVPADLGRAVPRRRVPQGRGQAAASIRIFGI